MLELGPGYCPYLLKPFWAGNARHGCGTQGRTVTTAGLGGVPTLPHRGVCGRHSCHAPPLFGCILLDVGGGTTAVEQSGGREHVPRPQDDTLLSHRLG